ncbi:hypothetical protein THARTR1_06212 [Trichoderma harzianum]|uniref:Uncharacterized protein n=1 Tax=Trichoderma harzianum TaxID=5544 RepID=A0A2K0U6X7_TRIHA|nr:hypothetical protein THARTR1_06212 [Trichoderma harzianum]
MNTVKSFWLGWGSLCVAGGGAYYFAKQQIRADRQAKLEAHHKKIAANKALEFEAAVASGAAGTSNGGPARTDNAGSPSQEASNDPAATRHAPATESQRVTEKSKYESDTPYRTRKGDRFS